MSTESPTSRSDGIFHPIERVSIPKHATAALFILIVGGAALRLRGLAHESLWLDELHSWHTGGYSHLMDVLIADSAWHLHPPAYHILLHYIQMWFGDSETALRFPSVVAGIMSIPLLFLLGVRFYSWREGLLSAGLLSVLWFPVYYSQEARPYAFLLLLTLAATLAWTYVLDAIVRTKPPRTRILAGYAALAFLLAYTHYFGLLMVFFQGIVAIAFAWRYRQGMWRVCTAYGVLAVAYLPWVPIMLKQLTDPTVGHPPPDGSMVGEFASYVMALFNNSRPLVAICALLLLAGGVQTARSLLARPRTKATWPSLLLLAWIAAPFLFAFLKSQHSSGIYTHRNLIVSLPAVYLFAAYGYCSVPFRPTLRYACAALLIATAFVRLSLSDYYQAPHKDQFREAALFVAGNKLPPQESAIVVYGFSTFEFDHYLMKYGGNAAALFAGTQEDIPKLTDLLARQHAHYVWYLTAYKTPSEAFMEAMNRQLRLKESRAFLGVTVRLYEALQ